VGGCGVGALGFIGSGLQDEREKGRSGTREGMLGHLLLGWEVGLALGGPSHVVVG
jgi:hypothetical protein